MSLKSPFLIGLCFVLNALEVTAADSVEEVVVTGSFIKQDPLRNGSPITTISRDNLSSYGLSGISDVINYLPFNSGSEFNADVFTQNLSAGTSNFNLRGLGLNSTLVLLNGRRQTVSGGVADDGSTFVDLNALVPLNTVDRIEILKDGATALYGTDAVAGVVNIITRQRVEGLELEADFSTTTRSSQRDVTLQGLYGRSTERFSGNASISHLRRSWLPSPERAYTRGKGFSSFGQPGAFILLGPSPTFPDLPFGLENPQSVIDPDCASAGGLPNETVEGSGLGTCTFDFAPYYHLIPRERRWLSFASGTLEFDKLEVFAEAGYADTSVTRGTSPSFPILNLASVPADNPGNVFQSPALFLGRPLGADAPENLVTHNSETWRVVAGLQGGWREEGSWTFSTSYSANQHVVKINDALVDQFDAALNGNGGPNGDQYFNPFGSAALSQPGDVTFNDPSVIAGFLSPAIYDYRTSLFSLDALASGNLIDLKSGAVGFAIGGQLRSEDIQGDLDDQFNAENYLFLVGGPDFEGQRTVLAAFGELNIPLSNTLDLQLAVRHESYEDGLRSTDPKVAISWTPTEWLAARASFGTAFRAPSVFQSFSSQTALQNINDPITNSVVFRGVRTVGTSDLQPEEADVINIGTTVTPIAGVSLSLDYWHFDYTNIIVKENAQALLDSDPFGPTVIRNAGQILRIDTNYVNAPSVETDGVDVSALYAFSGTGANQWSLSADLTYINQYTIQTIAGGPKRDVAGSRNFRTFARSLPKWRTTLGAEWSRNSLGVAAYVRTISGYQDDQNAARINSHVTVDTQLRYVLSEGRFALEVAPVLTFGVVNLFDQDPPNVDTNVGFDSKVHDPRGRVVYLRLKSGF